MVNMTTTLYCDPDFKTLSSDWSDSKGQNFQLSSPLTEETKHLESEFTHLLFWGIQMKTNIDEC